jgi:hypothetical protein
MTCERVFVIPTKEVLRASVNSTEWRKSICVICCGPTRRRTLRWPMWPTVRTVAILDIEVRPPKDRSQESSCPDAVRTAGWWFQQAAQRLRAVRNRGPQAARRGFGDGPGLAEAVV